MGDSTLAVRCECFPVRAEVLTPAPTAQCSAPTAHMMPPWALPVLEFRHPRRGPARAARIRFDHGRDLFVGDPPTREVHCGPAANSSNHFAMSGFGHHRDEASLEGCAL